MDTLLLGSDLIIEEYAASDECCHDSIAIADRQLGAHVVPVVIFSSNGNEEQCLQCSYQGAIHCLQRPFGMKEMTRCIAEGLYRFVLPMLPDPNAPRFDQDKTREWLGMVLDGSR